MKNRSKMRTTSSVKQTSQSIPGIYQSRLAKTRLKLKAASSLQEAPQSADDLFSWIRNTGGKVGNVSVRFTEQEGWFLQTTENVTQGSPLVELPVACQLSYRGQNDDERLLKLIGEVPLEFWAGKLCLKLLAERLKAERSFFWPYLQSLPMGVPGIPLFYTDNAIRALQYAPLVEQVKKRCRWLLSLSEEDRKQLSLIGKNPDIIPDANLIGWALAIVSSRAFKINGDKSPGSLLPVIDLCNHSFDPNCKVISDKSDVSDCHINLMATQDIPKGEQLLISYGELSNDDLLLDYGFIIKENPYDHVQISFDPETIAFLRNVAEPIPQSSSAVKTDVPNTTVLEQLKFGGPQSSPFVQVGRGVHTIDPRFVAGVRVLTSSTILDGVSLEELGSLDHPLDKEHDLEVLRLMAKILLFALQQLPSDVDSDQRRLASEQISDGNERLAIAFRIEKKQILLNAVRHIASKIRENGL